MKLVYLRSPRLSPLPKPPLQHRLSNYQYLHILLSSDSIPTSIPVKPLTAAAIFKNPPAKPAWRSSIVWAVATTTASSEWHRFLRTESRLEKTLWHVRRFYDHKHSHSDRWFLVSSCCCCCSRVQACREAIIRDRWRIFVVVLLAHLTNNRWLWWRIKIMIICRYKQRN